MRISTLFALALACSSCKHISFDSHPFAVEHPANTAPGGLEWHDLYIGEGPAAAAGDGVVFDYTLWLGDGTRVDSTLDRGVPLEAVIGSLPLEGLNQGLVGMRPGGRRRVHIPPELAYGSIGVPDLVPPDSALDCEAHMVEVKPASR
jgi:FKBP-type peptidyl-prolyl cis-trans isomerase